jgi:hypothetical protein
MRNGLISLTIISLAVTAFACGGTEGTQAAGECSAITCPTGTAPNMSAEADSGCSGSLSGERGVTSVGLSASAQCFGSGACTIVCEPVNECCGGESWSADSYTCEIPCTAACSCAGKCGTVAGLDCTAECGSCTGNQYCLDNECVDACPDDVTTCGVGICCDSGTAVCVAGECCDPVKNCTGRQCGDDGCGGQCEALGGGWGCDPGEVCENYECVTNTDCGGQLPVCEFGPDGEPTGVVNECGSSGKWQIKQDCADNEFGKTYCVQTSAGAVCAECSDDDDCSTGGICVVKPAGAECAECTDNVDCQSSDAGLVCDNGKCGCKSDAECGPGQECASDGICTGDVCDPEVVCKPEGGAERYCGPDGCGGWCDGKNNSCQGAGVCTAEGQCDPKAECKFQPNDDQAPVAIPYDMPFCNSMIPNPGTKLPPYDPNLPGEAVISCYWEGATDDTPFYNECLCHLHVEESQPDGLNCSAQGFLCRSTLEGWDNLNEDNTLEDFECLASQTCTEYMAELGVEGYVEDDRVCNNGYTEDYPEGWIVYCEDQDGLPKFRCENCESEDGGEEDVSPCDDDGVQCYPKDNDEDGVIDGASCEESKAAWCPQEDGTPGTNWQPGCCQLDEEGCHGVLMPGDDTGTDSEPGFNPEDDPDHDYEPPSLIKTCVYDEVTNEVTTETADCAADGNVCQVYATEGSEALVGTCVLPVEPCLNGKLYHRWCNAPGDGFDDAAPAGSVLFCAVNPYVQVKTQQAMTCDVWSNDPNSQVEEQDAGACNGAPAPEFTLLCVDQVEGAMCQQDKSQCCDVHIPTCTNEGAVESCTYDAATNTANLAAEPACEEGSLCVDFDYEEPGNPETPTVPEPAHCEPLETCPDGTDDQTWCNPPAGDPSHEAAYPEGALIHCNVQQPGNSKGISGQTCTDWGNDGANGASLDAEICGYDPGGAAALQLLDEDQQQWLCKPADMDSGQTTASCEQDRSPCCDVLTPGCDGNTPTTCAYSAESNTFEFLPQEPCQEGSETCIDFKWDFVGDLSSSMADTSMSLPAAQAPVCEAVLACPFGATAPSYHDSFCNPPTEAEGHHPDYQAGEAVKCLYFPESNQLRHMGQSCQAQIETSGGLTIEQQNSMCAPEQLDCCVYTDYICRDVPFDSGDAAGDSQALCMLDNSDCCEDFEPRCVDQNGLVTCEIEAYGSNAYYDETSCDEGDVCVFEKYGDLLNLADLQPVTVACEPAVSCPENEKGGAKFCNTDGQDGYDEAWGEAIIQCTYWQDTNQIIWNKSTTPADVCGDDEACFPAGDWACEWCKHPTDPDVLQDAEFNLSNPSSGTYNTPRCEEPQACPSGFCHPENGIVSCSHDPISNNLNFSFSECDDAHACVASAELNDTLVEYHDTLSTVLGQGWYENFVLSNGVVSIWNNPDTWESRCIPTGCGPEYTQPSSGDEVLQIQCGDPTLFTCYEDPDGDWLQAWDSFVQTASTGVWAPDLGCLPKRMIAFDAEDAYLTIDGDAFVEAPTSKPAEGSGASAGHDAVVFCNESSTGQKYFTNVPGETSGGAAPTFVIMGWQESLGTGGESGEIYAPFKTGYIYADREVGDPTAACSRCAKGPGPEDAEIAVKSLKCCLVAHGIMWEGAPNLSECALIF